MEFGNPVKKPMSSDGTHPLKIGEDTYRNKSLVPVKRGRPLQSVMCWHKKPTTAYDNLTQCRYKWPFDGNQAKV